MSLDHIKRGGDAVFLAGLPAPVFHFTLGDIYTALGILWFIGRFAEWLCPRCIAAMRRRLGR